MIGQAARSPAEAWPARRRVLEQLLLGGAPLALTLWLVVASIRFHWVAQDFSLAYYPAAHRLLAGGTPYAATQAQIVSGAAFVYPALSAVLLAPLALVTSGLADHLYTLVCLTMVPGSLWVLGVRDWRVYGVSLLWFPMVIGWEGENISVPMMFLIALAWRHRDRPPVAGLIVAGAISMKPFAWPLGLWLLATGRIRATVWAVAWGIALNVFAWGLVGLGAVGSYLRLSSADLRAMWRGGYGVPAIAHHLGAGRGAGELVLVIVAIPLAAAMLYLGLARRRQGAALVLSVALMLIASPLVWIHYFVLLLVPLAIARPRFAVVWVLPLAMWLLPPATRVGGWQIALAWVVVAGCISAALYPPREPRVRPGRASALEPAA